MGRLILRAGTFVSHPLISTLPVCSPAPSPGFPAARAIPFGNGNLTQRFAFSQLQWLDSALLIKDLYNISPGPNPEQLR